MRGRVTEGRRNCIHQMLRYNRARHHISSVVARSYGHHAVFSRLKRVEHAQQQIAHEILLIRPCPPDVTRDELAQLLDVAAAADDAVDEGAQGIVDVGQVGGEVSVG